MWIDPGHVAVKYNSTSSRPHVLYSKADDSKQPLTKPHRDSSLAGDDSYIDRTWSRGNSVDSKNDSGDNNNNNNSNNSSDSSSKGQKK
mmetsp:Transcript_10897/g.18249  ORF Transcript_10897/g.18249 Transcript_10897/m.18249 type:complete len:88 (+) Transcript_10897:366-629(+)